MLLTIMPEVYVVLREDVYVARFVG